MKERRPEPTLPVSTPRKIVWTAFGGALLLVLLVGLLGVLLPARNCARSLLVNDEGELEDLVEGQADALNEGDVRGACRCLLYGEERCSKYVEFLRREAPFFAGAKLRVKAFRGAAYGAQGALEVEASGPGGAGELHFDFMHESEVRGTLPKQPRDPSCDWWLVQVTHGSDVGP